MRYAARLWLWLTARLTLIFSLTDKGRDSTTATVTAIGFWLLTVVTVS
jgi:hypothetical protein